MKYEIGDKIWRIRDGKADEETVIATLHWNRSYYLVKKVDEFSDLFNQYNWIPEYDIFSTKQALLESL